MRQQPGEGGQGQGQRSPHPGLGVRGDEAGGGVGEAPGGVPAHDGEHLQHTRRGDVQKSGGAVSEYWKLHVV